MKKLKYSIKGETGECTATFLNTNQVDYRVTGRYTGLFRRVKPGIFGIMFKYGAEFGGYIGSDGIVRLTEGIYQPNEMI